MTQVVVAVVMGFMLLAPLIPADAVPDGVKEQREVVAAQRAAEPGRTETVSYTHLTLPTN